MPRDERKFSLWIGIMKQRSISLIKSAVEDVRKIRFWKHNWCAPQPLPVLYQDIYIISTRKTLSVIVGMI